MNIERYKNSKNKFILNGKKIKIPKKICLEFYNLISLEKYEEALKLIEEKSFKRFLPSLIIGGISMTAFLYYFLVIKGIVGLYIPDELFIGLYFSTQIGLLVSGSGLVKNFYQYIKMDDIRFMIESNIDMIDSLNEQQFELEEDLTNDIDKTNQNNSFNFDPNKSDDMGNVYYLDDYRDNKNKRKK